MTPLCMSQSTLNYVYFTPASLIAPLLKCNHRSINSMSNTPCLDQLYGCTVILLSSLCTPVRHFVITRAHTLLGPDILLCRLSVHLYWRTRRQPVLWPMGAPQIWVNSVYDKNINEVCSILFFWLYNLGHNWLMSVQWVENTQRREYGRGIGRSGGPLHW